jgi:hypothetical protein
MRNSPSPALARSHLISLNMGGVKSLYTLSAAQLSILIRLLGSSAYLSEILIRKGENWPELFLRQIQIPQKTVPNTCRNCSL